MNCELEREKQFKKKNTHTHFRIVVCYQPGTVLGRLRALSHLILVTASQKRLSTILFPFFR